VEGEKNAGRSTAASTYGNGSACSTHTRGIVEQRRRAVRTVAHHSRDAQDCLLLLDMLGLEVQPC
jgi:hypothetical protein